MGHRFWVPLQEGRVREKEGPLARGARRVIPDLEGHTAPRMWRDSCRPGRGPEGRKERLG